MRTYPVHFTVAPPGRFTPAQLLVRLIAFIGLGMLGLSFGTLFSLAYVALPAYAAARLASLGSTEAYRRDDGPRVQALLRWIAAVSAWVGLVVDRLPARSPAELVALTLDAEPPARHTASSALLRIVTGLPSALVLMVLCTIGIFVWLWAALSILLSEQVGPLAHQYLIGLQRWSVSLHAYQACLLDEYPPFSFVDGPAEAAGSQEVASSVSAAGSAYMRPE